MSQKIRIAKKSERIFWLVVTVSLLFNGYCNHTTLKSNKKQEEEKYLHLLKEAYHTIQNHYYNPSTLNKKALFHNALRGLFQSLGDPYSIFLDEKQFRVLKDTTEGKFAGIGIQLRFQDRAYYISQILEGSPAAEANLEIHDKITAINTEKITNWPFIRVLDALRGARGSHVTLSILRKKKHSTSHHITLTRQILDSTQVSHSILPHNIGYLKLSDFSHTAPKKTKDRLEFLKRKGIQALIFDLRSNPGGDPISCLHILNYFFNDKIILLYTYQKKTGQYHKYYSQENKAIFSRLPLVVLTNHASASASEIFIAAIQDHKRGIIIGEKTYGKGSVQTYIPSTRQSTVGFKITNALWCTPSGKMIHEEGITPDITTASFALTNKERYIVQELQRSRLLQDFIKRYPEASKKQDEIFIKLAQNKGYTLSKEILLHQLREEQRFHSRHKTLNLEHDPILRTGFNYLKSKSPSRN